MRKSFVFAAGLMCLALSITDCQKELVDQTTPASEPNFELFAQPVTTKTANDGLDTKWVAKDAINVFHAEAGSTLYVSDNQFTVKDIETGALTERFPNLFPPTNRMTGMRSIRIRIK